MSLRSNKKGTQAFSDNSPWIFTDSANTLFSKSRERVYGEEKDNDKSKYFSNRLPYLEESPKWHLLSIVLDEIKREREGHITQDAPSDTILILANDERTCYQLKEYLCSGGKRLLQRLFERFLGGKNRIDMTELPDEMKKHLMPTKTKGRYDKDGPPLSKRAKEEEEKGEDDDVTGVDTEIFSNFQLDDISMRPNIDDEGPGDFRLLQEPLIIIHSLNNSKDPCHLMKVLSSNKPRTIIMYDADIKLTREIEIFKASHCDLSLRVYFLIYDSSVEEQKYLSVIKKEKETFQQLIYEKAHMVIPADREGRCDDNSTVKRGSSDKPIESNNSRKAGGQKQSSSSGDGRPSVIVDMREFRSSLPSLIHKRGIDVIPLTIEVGDYILSPDICIERKSLADLIGSLNSGRLYNQAKAMTQHYKKSVLLIEFEEGQPFSLQSYNAVVGDVHSHSVAAKLVLLTIHFPKLRILWCPSPHFAAEMFEKLKIGQPQPDLTSAIISKSESFGLEGEQLYNPTLQDFLLKLPGINIKNYKYRQHTPTHYQ
jgi:DNA excision repair protein ERCC-4